ncbi:MAG: iron-containing alcohol dehydrogenase [bacterium]|nr:iron-containing alcohol dehydrogenase [bacterium]
MHTPEVLEENVTLFLEKNKFDLYIVNPYTRQFLSSEDKYVIVERAIYDELPTLMALLSGKNQRILAFGAGSVLDPAKYLAKMAESHLTVIPSALSVNSFATHRSSFLKDGSKVSVETVAPDTVVLDYNMIKTAGILNVFGLMELAATATAQIDWSLAIKNGFENDSPEVRLRSVELLKKTIKLLTNHTDTNENLKEVFASLLESGLLTQLYGNGRPVSGSEHIISAYVENAFPCAHGAGLYQGILIAASLQEWAGYSSAELRSTVEQLRTMKEIRDYIMSSFNKSDLIALLPTIKPRSDKYGILDIVPSSQKERLGTEVYDAIFE